MKAYDANGNLIELPDETSYEDLLSGRVFGTETAQTLEDISAGKEATPEIRGSNYPELDSFLNYMEGKYKAEDTGIWEKVKEDASQFLGTMYSGGIAEFASKSNAGAEVEGTDYLGAGLDVLPAAGAAGTIGSRMGKNFESAVFKYQGVDGKPRYLIDDTEVEYRPFNMNVSYNGEWVESVPIDQVLKHDKLYEEYPEIKDNLRILRDISVDGAFFQDHGGGKGTIVMGVTGFYPDQSVLMHEIQHWLQTRERIEKGTDPNVFDRDPRRKKIEQDADTELMKQQRALRMKLRDPATDQEDIHKQISELEDQRGRNRQKNSGYNWYESSAGEVEARTVADFFETTPEQIKAEADKQGVSLGEYVKNKLMSEDDQMLFYTPKEVLSNFEDTLPPIFKYNEDIETDIINVDADKIKGLVNTRPKKLAAVKEDIVEDRSPDKIPLPAITFVNGKVDIPDGNHRIQALIDMGVTDIPVAVGASNKADLEEFIKTYAASK